MLLREARGSRSMTESPARLDTQRQQPYRCVTAPVTTAAKAGHPGHRWCPGSGAESVLIPGQAPEVACSVPKPVFRSC
jgi:hypothetical protein